MQNQPGYQSGYVPQQGQPQAPYQPQPQYAPPQQPYQAPPQPQYTPPQQPNAYQPPVPQAPPQQAMVPYEQPPVAIAIPAAMEQAMFGGITPAVKVSIPRYKINHTTGMFELPGMAPTPVLTGVFAVAVQAGRVMWDPTKPPASGIHVCRSSNDIIPDPGGRFPGPCLKCPNSQWGQKGPNGEPAAKPLCDETLTVLLGDPTGGFAALGVSRTGLKPTREFFVNMFYRHRRPYFANFVTITLKQELYGGRPYYVPQWQIGQPTDAKIQQDAFELFQLMNSQVGLNPEEGTNDYTDTSGQAATTQAAPGGQPTYQPPQAPNAAPAAPQPAPPGTFIAQHGKFKGVAVTDPAIDLGWLKYMGWETPQCNDQARAAYQAEYIRRTGAPPQGVGGAPAPNPTPAAPPQGQPVYQQPPAQPQQPVYQQPPVQTAGVPGQAPIQQPMTAASPSNVPNVRDNNEIKALIEGGRPFNLGWEQIRGMSNATFGQPEPKFLDIGSFTILKVMVRKNFNRDGALQTLQAAAAQHLSGNVDPNTWSPSDWTMLDAMAS